MEHAIKARIWPTVGICAAAMMWFVSASANFWAGTQLAPSDAGGTALVLGGASVAADVLKTVALFLIIVSVAKQRWVVAATAGLILLLCVTWSFRSAVYFASSMIQERVADRQHAKKILDAEEELIKIRTQRAGFLSQQTVKLPGSGKPLRRAIVAEKKRTATEFKTLTQQIETGILSWRQTEAVPGADPIHEVFGVDENHLFIATALAFAILVEVVSATAFWVIAMARRPEGPAPPSAGSTQLGYGGVTSVAPTPPGPGNPSPGNRSSRTPSRARSGANARSTSSSVVSLQEYANDGQLRAAVENAFTVNLERQPGARTRITDVYNVVTEQLPPNKRTTINKTDRDHLSRLVRSRVEELGGAKRKISGRWYFVGLGIASNSPTAMAL